MWGGLSTFKAKVLHSGDTQWKEKINEHMNELFNEYEKRALSEVGKPHFLWNTTIQKCKTKNKTIAGQSQCLDCIDKRLSLFLSVKDSARGYMTSCYCLNLQSSASECSAVFYKAQQEWLPKGQRIPDGCRHTCRLQSSLPAWVPTPLYWLWPGA